MKKTAQQSTQQKEVQAAIYYAKGDWSLEDLKPLFRQGTDKLSDIPQNACAILAKEVERLRKELDKN
jgi:hypothetical protein